MSTHQHRKRLVGTVAAVVVAATAAGSAYGYWSSHGPGSGSGTAGVATIANLTIAPAAVGAGLYPGGTGSVALIVSNGNPSAVHLPSLVLDTSQGSSGYGVDSLHSGCANPALTFTSQSNGGQGWTIPAEVGGTNGTLNLTFPNAVSMGAGADNACQGATFAVYLKSGG